jgi:hypothetical protein
VGSGAPSVVGVKVVGLRALLLAVGVIGMVQNQANNKWMGIDCAVGVTWGKLMGGDLTLSLFGARALSSGSPSFI